MPKDKTQGTKPKIDPRLSALHSIPVNQFPPVTEVGKRCATLPGSRDRSVLHLYTKPAAPSASLSMEVILY